MKIDTNTLISISDANQNFSKVANLVDNYGAAVILKNNKLLYIITEFTEGKNKNKCSLYVIIFLTAPIILKEKK